MRVLVICPELPRDDCPGSMAPTARQIESLRRFGVEVDVVDMRGIPKLKYLLLMPKIRRLAKKVDIVHAHFGFCAWLAYLGTRCMWRKPPLVISFMGDDLLGTVYNDRGDTEWFSRQMVKANRWIAYHAKHVIVKSEQMARVIAPVLCDIISNGIDVETFTPLDKAASRERLGWEPDQIYVLFPGDPDNPRKGFPLARDAVEFAQRKLNRPIKIVPLWGVEPDDVSIYMNASDVMLMTSWIEGSPNVVKEAMACDLPVVGVPVGDVEQMLDGVPGYAFCQRNPEQIGDTLIKLLSAENIDGRKAILDRRLDLESIARRVLDIYQEMEASNPSTDKATAIAAASTHDAVTESRS